MYQIKNLIRSGNKPKLVQVAKRLGEISQVENKFDDTTLTYPIVKSILFDLSLSNTIQLKLKNNPVLYNKIIFDTFEINTSFENKWFLTKTNEIVATKCIIKEDNILIYGCTLKKTDAFFATPIKSTFLNIYVSDCEENTNSFFNVNNIKCKLVAISNGLYSTVFLSLIHTL